LISILWDKDRTQSGLGSINIKEVTLHLDGSVFGDLKYQINVGQSVLKLDSYGGVPNKENTHANTTDLDHIAFVLERREIDDVVASLRQLSAHIEVSSIAGTNFIMIGDVSLVLVEKQSDIVHLHGFSAAGGGSVQHIAFNVKSIDLIVSSVLEKKVSFVPLLSNESLHANEYIATDKKGGGVLKQAFISPVDNFFFVELIEREKCHGFTQKNYTELFNAVEKHCTV